MLLAWRGPFLAGGLLALAACDGAEPPPHLRIDGADPARGVAALERYGCGGCHTIPGVRGARGTVGPPLTAFAARGYVAGVVPNWPRHLVHWIMDPPAISPQTAMPNLGVSEPDARDIAAYLYTLGAGRAAVYPPAPQPPPAAPNALEALRSEEDRLLDGADPAQLSIERAMRLLIERGPTGAGEPPPQ